MYRHLYHLYDLFLDIIKKTQSLEGKFKRFTVQDSFDLF